MQTKLTLRIEKRLIESAKRYSKKRGKSLSQLFSDYLIMITKTEDSDQNREILLPPITASLKGILRGKKVDEKDYKTYLEGKYK
jgi:hypothetical protein